MDMEIRHAERADGDELLELWHGFTDHLSQYDDRYTHSDDADERWLTYFENQLLGAKYGTVLVADAGDELAGVLEARVTGAHPIFRIPDHGKINGLYVVEDYRGEGIGQALVNEALEWFTQPARDVDSCRINLLEGDEMAETIYTEMGFEPVEHTYELHLDE